MTLKHYKGFNVGNYIRDTRKPEQMDFDSNIKSIEVWSFKVGKRVFMETKIKYHE